MDENLKNTAGNSMGENAPAENNTASNRVKRMRGWLGVNTGSTSHGCYVEGEAPSYGDAPNGWNR